MFIQVIILHFFIICLSYEIQVQVSDGLLQGTVHKSRKGRDIYAFLGIPYAEPPIGKLRFSNPVPVNPWKGVREATKDANQCPQYLGHLVFGFEDCLYLNVYTPRKNVNSSVNLLPVMVWIHGGAFISGNSSFKSYGANYLLDKDVILVSMNYRLGILGFFSTGDLIAPGNFGMKDQVLALKWVQKNIRAFGGDPNQVTLFGQSAGGVSVGLHVISDASNDLFHRYIIQSGSVLVPWGFQKSSQYKLYSRNIATIHLCPIFNSNMIVDCLRKKDFHQLLETSSVFNFFARFAQLTWTPTDEPESENAFLIDSPENLIEKNKMKDLPFITGNVANEGKVISQVLYSNLFLYNTIRFWIKSVIDYFSGYYLRPNNILQFRKEIIKYYFNGLISDNKDEFIQNLSNLINDAFFLYPQMKLLEKTAKRVKSPFYFYIFNYQGAFIPSFSKRINSSAVGHNEDLFYLFPLEYKRLESKGDDEKTIDLMVDLWTSFVVNGIPYSKQLKNSNFWRKYITGKKYLHIQGDFKNQLISLENKVIINRINFWKKGDSGLH